MRFLLVVNLFPSNLYYVYDEPGADQIGEFGQAALAEHEQFGALMVGIEKVAPILSRCTIYEALYRFAL